MYDRDSGILNLTSKSLQPNGWCGMSKTTLPVSITELEALHGWAKLPEPQKRTLTEETTALSKALQQVSQAKLLVGEHLYNVREILDPLRVFTKYLKTMFHMSKATAYRYIALYTAAKSIFSKPVLEVAMMRPDDRLTLQAIKDAPKPPRTANVIAINDYLDRLQQTKPTTPTLQARTPTELQRVLFHSIRLVLNKMSNPAKRKAFEIVCGMVLSEIGVKQLTIKASAVPDTFQVSRGRPKQQPRKAA